MASPIHGKQNKSSRLDRLRDSAEGRLRKSPISTSTTPGWDVPKLVHELEVHQVELELQNEELRRTQLELEASRDRFAMLYDFAPVGYLTLDTRGVIREANLTVARLLGIERAKCIGQRLHRYAAATCRRDLYLYWREVFTANAKPFCELQMVGPKGKIFSARLDSVVWPEPSRPKECLVALSDISERKRAEMALRESEQNLNDFFEQSPLSLFWVGLDGCIQRVNRAGLNLLGRTSEKCLGQPVSRFFVDPEIGLHALTQLACNKTLQNYRARIRCKDGSVRHVLIDANGLWERGVLMFSRWLVRDITDRVELEREILGVSEREQQRLGQDLHDDLCQQLSGIEFLSQTLARHLATTSKSGAARAGEIARMVRLAIDHARDLAHGLSPARLEGDGLTIALQQLAARTERIFHIGCRFHCDAPVLIHDNATAIHLYRIAQEAVGNAIKHGRARSIDIGLTTHDKDIILAIRDNGIGISVKLRKRKGMGLRVMQYRAGVIGGSLVVERQPNGGTSVVCTIKRGIQDHENQNER